MLNSTQAIVLDIEGTTTPVNFVYGVLFPYAQQHMATFLRRQGHTPAVQADLQQLYQEYQHEPASPELPAWSPNDHAPTQSQTEPHEPLSALPFITYLMARDRKSTGLKALQGKVWDQGYADGSLKAQLFDDVAPALQAWQAQGKRIYIYSSGSIQAQQLLFKYTEKGNFTSLLSGYFDTTTGAKQDPTSYQKIAQAIGVPANQILFISDIVAELIAAQTAGLQTRLSLRPGNTPQAIGAFTTIASFDEVQL